MGEFKRSSLGSAKFLKTNVACAMALFTKWGPSPFGSQGLSPGRMVSVCPPANEASTLPKLNYARQYYFLVVHMPRRWETFSSCVVSSRVCGNDGEA